MRRSLWQIAVSSCTHASAGSTIAAAPTLLLCRHIGSAAAAAAEDDAATARGERHPDPTHQQSPIQPLLIPTHCIPLPLLQLLPSQSPSPPQPQPHGVVSQPPSSCHLQSQPSRRCQPSSSISETAASTFTQATCWAVNTGCSRCSCPSGCLRQRYQQRQLPAWAAGWTGEASCLLCSCVGCGA